MLDRTSGPLLDVKDLHAWYGESHILHGATLQVNAGEVVIAGAFRGSLTLAGEALAPIEATLVFYESGPRLAESLADMQAALGDRPAAVARELTKLFEETRRDTLQALAAQYAQAGAPKGEIVVIVAPPPHAEVSNDVLDAFLSDALTRGGVKDAAQAAADELGVARKRAYARALELKA